MAASSPAVSAQATASAGVIRGVVEDAARQTPVEGASVEVVGAGLVALTDALGRFELRGVPEDYVVLRATRLGYAPLEVRAHPGALAGPIRLLLVPRALPLAGVSVDVESTRRELESRRQSIAVKSAVFHRGQFIDNPPDDLAAWAAVRTGTPLVGCSGDVFAERSCMAVRGGTTRVRVFLDEMPLTGDLAHLRMIPPGEIGRIEVYPVCGTLRVYTVRFLTSPGSRRWIGPLWRC